MLAQKIIVGYGSKLVAQGAQVVAGIVVARVAGPTVLGTLAFGLAFVSMFQFLADLGTGSAHIKLISEGEDLGSCISIYSILKIACTCIYIIVVLGVYLIQKYVLNIHFASSSHEPVILIMLLTVIISELLYIPRTTFMGATEQAKQDLPDLLRTVCCQALRIGLVLLGYEAVALALGELASTLFVIPIFVLLFKDYPMGKPNRALVVKYLRLSAPILLIGMSTKIVAYLDKVALEYFAGSKEVGYYSAASRVGDTVLMLANSAGLLFFPLFSKAASEGNYMYIGNKVDQYQNLVLQFIMPGVILLSLYSNVVVRLVLGLQYAESARIMEVTNLAMLVNVLNLPYVSIIMGLGLFRLAAIVSLAGLLFFVCCISVLAHPSIMGMGGYGVALAVLMLNLFNGVIFRVYSAQKCPQLNMNRNLRYVAFGAVSYLFFSLLYRWIENLDGSFARIGFVFIYLIATYGMLFWLRWMSLEDVYVLKEVVDLKKVFRYIRKELGGY